VQDFVNTLDVENGTDLLSDSTRLADWLRDQGIRGGDGAPTRADVATAAELREALRALLRANAGGDPDPDAAAVVNRAAERAPLRMRLDPAGRASLEGAGGGDFGAALAAILAAAYAAMADGSWTRLKVCLDPECEWAFYDRSRNRSSHWCDMAACGSRHKMRAYRERRHTAGQ
jgi:predicted RNA-binding Zn ribbon-like protein